MTNVIKLVSLKGYEYEIYEAYPAGGGIRRLEFVPNQGYLISADDRNLIRAWDLTDLRIPPRSCQLMAALDGERDSPVVICLHTP